MNVFVQKMNLRRLLSGAIGCALLMFSSPRPGGAQMTTSPAPVVSAALPRLILTPDMLAGLPRRTVTVTEEKGLAVTYSGVDLDAMLAKNGAPHWPALRGAAGADYVLVRAADGYRTVFALVELDPAVTDKIVLLADQRNGAALGSDLGPFRLIVPDEKHHLRWIRNVVEIEVVSPP
jgi:hypothetical protein